MNVEDMILVSIDDHVIEPRDMFDQHVPDRWKDQAPRSVLNDEGIERWVFQDIESGSGQPQRGGRVAEGGLGHGPHHLRRDATRRVRRRRARPRHGPQRDPGVDVLPLLRRASAAASSSARPTRTSRS